MPVYEVIISGFAVGDDGDTYLEIKGEEDYIDYNGREDELAADILSSFKDKGIRLVRTAEMRLNDTDRIKVNIRSEGIGKGIKTTTISDMMDKIILNYDANKKPRTRKTGSHHPTGAGSTKIRKERAKLSKEYFKGEKK